MFEEPEPSRYSVQFPSVEVPSTHAVLTGGGVESPPLLPPHAVSSAKNGSSHKSLPSLKRRFIYMPLYPS
jgi:hypothetical protein